MALTQEEIRQLRSKINESYVKLQDMMKPDPINIEIPSFSKEEEDFQIFIKESQSERITLKNTSSRDGIEDFKKLSEEITNMVNQQEVVVNTLKQKSEELKEYIKNLTLTISEDPKELQLPPKLRVKKLVRKRKNEREEIRPVNLYI